MLAAFFPDPARPAAPTFAGLTYNADGAEVSAAFSEFSYRSQATNRTVTLYSSVASWDEAAAACSARGASLFVPTATEGLQELAQAATAARNMSGRLELQFIWIGVERLAGSDTFVAVQTGAQRRQAVPRSLLRWEPAAPAGKASDRVCVLLRSWSTLRHSVWMHDYPCGERAPYACARRT